MGGGQSLVPMGFRKSARTIAVLRTVKLLDQSCERAMLVAVPMKTITETMPELAAHHFG